MQCEPIAEQLAGVADGSVRLDPRSQEHVEHCLRCQAEIVQYRKLLRAMRTLRTEQLEPMPGLLGEVLLAVEEAGERHAIRSVISGKRIAYLGGLAAAATAAGVGGALVLARRRRIAA